MNYFLPSESPALSESRCTVPVEFCITGFWSAGNTQLPPSCQQPVRQMSDKNTQNAPIPCPFRLTVCSQGLQLLSIARGPSRWRSGKAAAWGGSRALLWAGAVPVPEGGAPARSGSGGRCPEQPLPALAPPASPLSRPAPLRPGGQRDSPGTNASAQGSCRESRCRAEGAAVPSRAAGPSGAGAAPGGAGGAAGSVPCPGWEVPAGPEPARPPGLRVPGSGHPLHLQRGHAGVCPSTCSHCFLLATGNRSAHRVLSPFHSLFHLLQKYFFFMHRILRYIDSCSVFLQVQLIVELIATANLAG